MFQAGHLMSNLLSAPLILNFSIENLTKTNEFYVNAMLFQHVTIAPFERIFFRKLSSACYSQVPFHASVPISTWNAVFAPTSSRRICPASWSFSCHGCPSGLISSRRRPGPHSASSPYWQSPLRVPVFSALCPPVRLPRPLTSGWRRVLCLSLAPSSNTRWSTLWPAARRLDRPSLLRRPLYYFRP